MSAARRTCGRPRRCARAIAALLAAALLDGCMLGPDFVRPAPPQADRYTQEPLAATIAADGQAQQFAPGAALPADWWRLFGSAPMNGVVEQALARNPTLQSAEASLRQSQDNLRAGYGIFFPSLDAGLSATRMRSAPQQQGSTNEATVFNVVTASGVISYPLDWFGGERRAVEGLAAQVDLQRNAGRAAYLTLSANVVDACIARAAYAAQLRATEQLIALETEQLRSVEAQVDAGTTPYAAILSQQALIAGNQAQLAALRQKISQAEHLLALLMGSLPEQAALPDIALDSLALPATLPLSLPSELVRQRPDILQAEARLHAASADIGVATAAMFPSLSLSATYGSAGSKPGNFLAAGNRFWGVGPALAMPLFHGGSLWYGRQAAIDAYRQQEANYRQTVLQAFGQVADALNALQHDAQALQAQRDARNAAAGALQLLQANYRAGLVAYLDVLSADIQLHGADIAYLQAVAQRQQDTVALLAALGGGWWSAAAGAGEGAAP
ncbi:RND transporter [Chromobacterium sphagni]|uniref:RND transporter n=1 Tax=Chromobacterium sphagni TaxID=1903179 RepID=A0A1S1WWQ6_9NEIS|nr:efflux transporter outer membrane subunit [Chromobacterium sphagni]OHX11709.1 RND transporter [Chromobacterium sphagni]